MGLPVISGITLIKFLSKRGFKTQRQEVVT